MLLSARELRKRFRLGRGRILHAVDGVSLDLAEGEVLGLVGESGSGKTTFGKLLVGLLPRTSGQVLWRGQPMPARFSARDHKRHSRDMQMVFQDPYASLNPRMTALELVGEGLRIQGLGSAGDRRDQVVHWLERVGLGAEHLPRYPHEFSGGQRQRLGIARAMVLEPRFLVCDEPLSALDVSVQAQVVGLLEELRQAMGLTLLFIAHDLSMVRQVSHRMAVMYLGALVETGPSDAVFASPKHPYTQFLVASNPQPDPRAERRRAHAPIPGEVASPINLAPGCRFAGRCPKALPECRRETPPLIALPGGRQVACHLYP